MGALGAVNVLQPSETDSGRQTYLVSMIIQSVVKLKSTALPHACK